jgi:uncharacterized protein (TIGR00299 family) protein
MKFLYIDCIGGASGDMLLGAFLDEFVAFEYLQLEINKLKIDKFEISLSDTQRHHISAKKFTVKTNEQTHRHLADIEKLISNSDLNEWIKEQSILVFRMLGEQEAKIHNIPVEKVHFHEVGAVDSIIDIVGTFICLASIKPGKIFTSPLPASKGLIKAAHGHLPVPAPATLALLKNYPLNYRPIDGELVTPTGAALIKHISQGLFPANRQFTVTSIGYGAGNKDWEELPNLLRIWQGELSDKMEYDSVYQIETNIDDMNPELFPHLQEVLMNAGALDVTLYHGIMKKGRPGILISILADATKLEEIKKILYSETSTIGFRYFPIYRKKLKRELKFIDSPWGKIQVKKVLWDDEDRLLPEYEECRRIARENGIPLIDVFSQVQKILEKKKM